MSFAGTAPTETNSIPVYVDGKMVSSITARQIANNLKLGQHEIKNVPTQNQWFSVAIKNSKGTTLSFQDWQRHYQGKEIILSKHENKQLAGLYYSGNSKPLYLLSDIEGIFIETSPPAANMQNVQHLPPLQITIDGVATLVEYRYLGEATEHGWQLEHLINAIQRVQSNKKVPINRFELACDNGVEKLLLSRPNAELTFLKVNQRNQWRAIVTEADEGKSKKNWKKCRQLVNISLY